MPFERKSGYELKFINENDFEIFCLDYNDTNSLRRELEVVSFVTFIASAEEWDEKYLQKILGKTSNKENLVAFLDSFFDSLAEKEVTTFSAF